MIALVLALLLHAEPPRPGSVISVEMNIGSVTVEVQGRLVPCRPGKQCAQLQNGKRVIGHIEGDRFIVEEAP